MLFQPGQSGNPAGRKKGTVLGRSRALALLDAVLGESRVQKVMKAALRKELEKNPVGFFKSVVMPLMPKDPRVAVGVGVSVTWKGLLGGEVEQRCLVSGVRVQGEEGGGEGVSGQETGVRCQVSGVREEQGEGLEQEAAKGGGTVVRWRSS